jgi:2-(1,2-epoxy-1,2-dihydrophenyl)acetyl-CoA isomerase
MGTLRFDLNNGVLLLTIDRPKANAFNLELIGELQSAFKQAARDSQVRAVVLIGAGRVFGAGQDIDEIQAGGADLSFREHLQETYNPLVL